MLLLAWFAPCLPPSNKKGYALAAWLADSGALPSEAFKEAFKEAFIEAFIEIPPAQASLPYKKGAF